MKLYVEMIKLIINKFIFRKNNGTVIKNFCEKMGIVYIKFAQMLATQNYGNIFTEEDRQMLSSICDNCNPISFDQIEMILKKEYGENLSDIFCFIEKEPVGSASISQVHRARLKTGEEVAIKIKRQDITQNIEKEIERLKQLVHRFGKFVNFGNYMGSDQALDLFLKWIREEINFKHEKDNIQTYQTFANTVNHKVTNTKEIKVPKLYPEYCTDNILVMEFIHHKTINQLELTTENSDQIVQALNSYIKASFYALFNDLPIIFHGDPHSGNIYIDEDGNIGFLDMGLLFVLSDEDARLIKKFFLTAYSRNDEKLYDILVGYGNMDENTKNMFKEDCKTYCNEIKSKDVTCYFTDMINICLKYEFVPPNFLFCMAKAFVCLNGINHFSNNQINAVELLQEQTMEYLVKRSLNDCEGIITDSLRIMPKAFENTLQYGLVNTIAKSTTSDLGKNVKNSLENLKEMLMLVQTTYFDEVTFQGQKINHL